jgi:hypothetical protein
MALLSFVDSSPRAYWLKAGNAYLTFSTSAGTFPALFGGLAEYLNKQIVCRRLIPRCKLKSR